MTTEWPDGDHDECMHCEGPMPDDVAGDFCSEYCRRAAHEQWGTETIEPKPLLPDDNDGA